MPNFTQRQNQPVSRGASSRGQALTGAPGSHLPAGILYLQRTAGNQAVQQWLQAQAGQGDASGMGAAATHPGGISLRGAARPARAPGALPPDRAGDSSGVEHASSDVAVIAEPTQRPGDDVTQLSRAEGGVRGPGQPLPVGTRALLEAQFGSSFAAVRLHTDPQAAHAARQLGAAAYTLGRDIAFGSGFYAPHTGRGLHLLAHELTHVLQAQHAASGRGTGEVAEAVSLLEAEAAQAADTLGRGRPHVRGRLAGRIPLFHPVYISAHGDKKYLDKAAKFYADWGYSPVHTGVPSIEAIVKDLAGQASIDHVTLVSHANPQLLMMQFLDGGPDTVRKSDWLVDTVAKLPNLEQHLVDAGTLQAIINNVNVAAQGFLGRIGGAADPLVRQFIWWVVEQVNAEKGNYAAAGFRLKAQAKIQADLYRTAVRKTLIRAGGGSRQPADVDQALADAEQVVINQARGVDWAAVKVDPARIPGYEQQFKEAPSASVVRLTETPDFFANLDKVRAKITASSWIEIQGCNAGADPAYLAGVQSFFGGAVKPKVSAPDWFQIFGTFASKFIPDTAKAAQQLWAEPGVREALAYWVPIVTGKQLPKRPTFQDLRDYLRQGYVLPPAPTGASGTDRVLYLAGKGPGPTPKAFLTWLSRHKYLISAEADIKKRLFTQQGFGDNVSGIVVDWLQERYPGSSKIVFRPAPEYDKHIIIL